MALGLRLGLGLGLRLRCGTECPGPELQTNRTAIKPRRRVDAERGAGLTVRPLLRKPHPRWRLTVEDSQNAEQDLTAGSESAHSSANESGRRGIGARRTLYVQL